jgi:hypothetical protein
VGEGDGRISVVAGVSETTLCGSAGMLTTVPSSSVSVAGKAGAGVGLGVGMRLAVGLGVATAIGESLGDADGEPVPPQAARARTSAAISAVNRPANAAR